MSTKRTIASDVYQKQSNSNVVLYTAHKFLKVSNEVIPSNSEVTYNLKRSLLNKSVDSFKIKKNKLATKNSIEEPFEVNNNDDIVLIESDSNSNSSNDNVKLIYENTLNDSIDGQEMRINNLTKNSTGQSFGVKNNDDIVLIESDSESNSSINSHEIKKNKLTKNSNNQPVGVQNNDDIVLIESDSDKNHEYTYEKMLDNILEQSLEKNRKDFPFLFESLADKNVSFDRFENFYRQMIRSHMTGILATCKKYYTYDIQLLIAREKHWKSKYEIASKKLKELTSVSNIVAKSHMMINDVELNMQTLLCSKKEGLPQSPKMTMYLKQLNNEPINITDDDDNVVLLDKIDHLKPSTSGFIQNKASGKHPAPLPHIPKQKSLISWGKLPPAPIITVSRSMSLQYQKALVLSWNMPVNKAAANVISYHIYAYCENTSDTPKIALWQQIGDINAVTLPMSCSLIEYVSGATYHFAVRAIDKYSRVGPFSIPYSISV